jgi:hypothetical protein
MPPPLKRKPAPQPDPALVEIARALGRSLARQDHFRELREAESVDKAQAAQRAQDSAAAAP